MRLYVTPGGNWQGTEKNFNAALKAEGLDPKTYDGRRQVDVPTSKPELLEFLTFHGVNPIAGSATLSASRVTTGVKHAPAAPVVAPTTIPDLDAAFMAAPVAKQVELAVALLDRLEAQTRR